MIWPSNLAVFYPIPQDTSAIHIAGAFLALVLISVFAIRWARQYPFFIVGWLWFLGTLLPVIGLVKIGDFAMADRYTYIPLIGLFVVIAWGIPEICAHFNIKKRFLGAAAIIMLVSLSLVTFSQVRYWSNSISLFKHALRVTENNFFAHYALGRVYARQGRVDLSIAHFKKAVHINSNMATLHSDLGRALATRGKFKKAIQKFDDALEVNPEFPEAHFSMANVLVAQQKYHKAIFHFSETIRLYPNLMADQPISPELNLVGYDDIISSLQGEEEIEEEIRRYLEILSKNPDDFDTLRKLAIAYSVNKDYDQALALLRVNTSTDALIKAIKKGYKKWRLIKSLNGS
jgi:tetratricopeptide (TPR) repeat protein